VGLIRAIAAAALALAGAGCGNGEPSTKLPYPPARTVSVVDDYHGTKVADPYRWLEDVQAQEVRDFAAAQTTLALPYLRENAAYPIVRKRIDELGRFFDALDDKGDERPPIDEASLGEGKSLGGAWPSPDKRWIAYAVSDRGGEWLETRLRRAADGRDTDERLTGWLWTDALWTKDSRGFFYVRSQPPAPGERTAMKSPAVFYHLPGTPQSADKLIYATPEGNTDLVLVIEMSGDGRYLFIAEGNGAHVDSIGWLLARMSILDLGQPARPDLARPLIPLNSTRDAAYRVIATSGDTLFVYTDRHAPRRRLVAVDVRQPAVDRWRDVIPESAEVLDSVSDVDGQFVGVYLRDVQHLVRVFGRDGRLRRELNIPPMTTVMSVERGAAAGVLRVTSTSFLSPPSRADHNLSTGAVTPVMPAPKSPGVSGYEVSQVWYRSKDGTRIPMWLVHRAGLVRDGSHPVILVGYGASGSSMTPGFGENAIAALDLGFVVAAPALRGGGEFGRAWYDAAILERKQNTFDDFIAAAEFLIAERYTSPKTLAIVGASNGGLLVTAVINQRPDLFRVAVAEVPQTDALRYDRGRHTAQFGTSANPAHVPFLLAYSPQQNIRSGTCYPSTLVTTAMNDDRSPAWMALKYVAALQAAQACDRPVLLRADPGGGHSGDFARDAADALAFIATQLGVR
jgi:prolyl oligopeptidase